MKSLSVQIPIPSIGPSLATNSIVAVETAPPPPIEVTAVPEPSPVFLLVGALALVFLLKRGGSGGS